MHKFDFSRYVANEIKKVLIKNLNIYFNNLAYEELGIWIEIVKKITMFSCWFMIIGEFARAETPSSSSGGQQDAAQQSEDGAGSGLLENMAMAGGIIPAGLALKAAGAAEIVAGANMLIGGGNLMTDGTLNMAKPDPTGASFTIGQGEMLSGQEMQAEGTALKASGAMKVMGGYALMGVGALGLAQAAMDQLGGEDAGKSGDASAAETPSLGDSPSLPAEDQLTGGTGIFSGKPADPESEETKEIKASNDFLRRQGVSFDAQTGIISTPVGEIKGTDLDGGIDGLKGLGLSDSVAAFVQGEIDGAVKSSGSSKGLKLANKTKPITKLKSPLEPEVGEDPFGSVYASIGGGASSKKSRRKRSRFNPVDLYKKLSKKSKTKRKLAGQSKIKKKLIHGIPVGARHEDIFQQVTRVYLRKVNNNYFLR